MSNSRLLQMYGFTEENNPYDDVYIPDDVIKAAIEKHNVEAKDAKIKLLDSLGFFSEGYYEYAENICRRKSFCFGWSLDSNGTF